MVEVKKKRIFVFGSNLAGIHGAGSAKAAYLKHGATYGVGSGPTGSSYAIPTKDHEIRTMRLDRIRPYVMEFLDYAKRHPELEFDVVKIGCGLAGFKDEHIAPMFRGHPSNVHLHEDWRKYVIT